MKKTINEIMEKYTTGEATPEETNAALEEAGIGFRLVPGKNTLTEEELRSTTVGAYPDMANGWGLLDSGTGTLDKVEVRAGKLVNLTMGESKAMVLIGGKAYYVAGDTLTDEDTAPEAGEVLPDEADMGRRMDLAGQVAQQRTKKGIFAVTYNADGYAVKAKRI